MTYTAELCKKQRHHPEWSNAYSTVFVRWTTHQPAGLSAKDVEMAAQCDDFAQRDDSRELDDEGVDTAAQERLKGVADGLGNEGKECCTLVGLGGGSIDEQASSWSMTNLHVRNFYLLLNRNHIEIVGCR